MTQQAVRTLIYPEWLVDGNGRPARQGQALAFSEQGGRIEAVGAAAELGPREGDTVVRAAGATLLPGLINMHAHLNLASDNAPFIPYMDAHSDVALALRAAFNATASKACARWCGGWSAPGRISSRSPAQVAARLAA